MAWKITNVEVPSNGGGSDSFSSIADLNKLPCMSNRVPVYNYILTSGGREVAEEDIRDNKKSIVYCVNKGFYDRQTVLYANLPYGSLVQHVKDTKIELLDSSGNMLNHGEILGDAMPNEEAICGPNTSNLELIFPLSDSKLRDTSAVNLYIDIDVIM